MRSSKGSASRSWLTAARSQLRRKLVLFYSGWLEDELLD